MAGHDRRLRWYGSTLKLLEQSVGSAGTGKSRQSRQSRAVKAVKGPVGKKSVVVIKQGSNGGPSMAKAGDGNDGSSRASRQLGIRWIAGGQAVSGAA